jgi:dTDP-4-amino-4,6-dideoxygalactose transaminase
VTEVKIPLVDLVAQFEEIAQEVRPELEEVFAKASFIGGEQIASFERQYADEIGVAHCIGVANGTDALELALRAVGVRPGGEVILPANTFIATAEAVSRIGAVPVLVDVDEEYLLIDPAAVEAAVTPRTQAVLPVHLFGQNAFLEQLQPIASAVGVPIVEDVAQAQGAVRNGRVAGSVGAVAGTSFYPGKNLGAAGDAGAVTTDDEHIAEMVRLLGSHGSAEKYCHDVVGMNSRMDTLQAVVLRAKLPRLAKWNHQRREAAARYATLLSDLPEVRLPRSAPGNEDVWHLYVVQVDDRDRILADLNAHGIGAGIHYRTPIHLSQAYRHLGLGEGAFPVAERAARRLLSLPLFPHITVEQQAYVTDHLRAALSSRR